MFGSLGGPELIAILILALILFGPRRIPEISRTIAKGLNEFRRATHDFKSTLEREVDMEEIRDVKKSVSDTVKEARAVTSGRLFDEPVARRPAAAADATDGAAHGATNGATDGETGGEPPPAEPDGDRSRENDGEPRT